MKRNIIRTLIGLTVFFYVVGCFSKPSETVVSSVSCIIDSKGVEFNLPSPLQRKFRSGSVRLELTQNWEPLPPWTFIQLSDGRQANITVTLFSSDGKSFMSKILGSAGGMLDARFDPEIPKDVQITNIRITSNIPLTCTRVEWYDYNPL